MRSNSRSASIIPDLKAKVTGTFLASYVDHRRWVYWKYEPKKGNGFEHLLSKPADPTKNDDYLKIPINPRTGAYASHSDPATWGTFTEACAVAEADPQADGIGIVLTGDGLVCIDPDDCVDPKTGEVDPGVRVFLDTIQGPVERSISGTGLHVFAKADLPKKFGYTSYEVYSTERFIALTGDFLPEYPANALPERTTELQPYIKAKPTPTGGEFLIARYVSNVSDEEIVRRIEESHQGVQYVDLRSLAPSRALDKHPADYNLLVLIGDFTCDIEQVVRIFNQSTLASWGRWADKPKYRETTIENVTRDKAEDWSILHRQRSAMTTSKKRFRFLSIEEALSLPMPEYIIEGYLPEKAITMMYGQSGSNKSFLCLDMAFHVALGLDWYGQKVKQGPVAYLAAEGGMGMNKRLAAWLEYHQTEAAQAGPLKMLYETANFGDVKQTLEFVDAVGELEEPPTLLILDTLSWLMIGSDESTSRDASRVLEALLTLRERYGTTSVLVHHTGHDGRLPRGSYVWIANTDTLLKVVKMKPDTRCKLVVEKQKDDEQLPPKAFERVVVAIPGQTTTGGDGIERPVTSCVIEPRDLFEAVVEDSVIQNTEKEVAILRALEGFGAAGATDADIKRKAEGCQSGGRVYVGTRDNLIAAGKIVADPRVAEGSRGRKFWHVDHLPKGLIDELDDDDVIDESLMSSMTVIDDQ